MLIGGFSQVVLSGCRVPVYDRFKVLVQFLSPELMLYIVNIMSCSEILTGDGMSQKEKVAYLQWPVLEWAFLVAGSLLLLVCDLWSRGSFCWWFSSFCYVAKSSSRYLYINSLGLCFGWSSQMLHPKIKVIS